MIMRRLPRRMPWLLAAGFALILVAILAACTGADDESGDETPTRSTLPTTAPSTSATVPVSRSPTRPAASPAPAGAAATPTKKPQATNSAGGQIITDGICTASVPDDWADDGTGRGTTATGARFILFGGRVNSDDDWAAGVKLVEDQAKKSADAVVTKEDTFIRVDSPDDQGFEYRGRFDNRYCDLTITSFSAIPEAERAGWDAIIDSLAPVTAN